MWTRERIQKIGNEERRTSSRKENKFSILGMKNTMDLGAFKGGSEAPMEAINELKAK